MSRIRRILHPTDFSRAPGAAFTKALEGRSRAAGSGASGSRG